MNDHATWLCLVATSVMWMIGCMRSSLYDRDTQAAPTPESVNVVTMDMDTNQHVPDQAKADASRVPELVASSSYVVHGREERVEVCISHERGCFDDVRPTGLPLLFLTVNLVKYVESDARKTDYEALLDAPHYAGFRLAHQDGKYHLFECPVNTRENYDYALEDVYVRCDARGALIYRYHEKPEDFEDEARMVYDACIKRERVGPYIDEPWFSMYKQAIASQDDDPPYLLSYSLMVSSRETMQGFEIGTSVVYYVFGDRNVCGPPFGLGHNHEEKMEVTQLDLTQP